MLLRVLEPEVMDERDEATSYNEMDHQTVNQRFAEDLLRIPGLGADWLDLGTGTALIPIEICKQTSIDVRIMAMDASYWMLEIARYNLEIQQCTSQVQLMHGDAKKLVFEDNYFDTVFSNSLVHHLPTHPEFFSELVRVLRPNGVLFIRDLLRPDSDQEVESLVAMYGGSDSHGQQMLRQSLYAALTIEEVRELAAECGIPGDALQQSSDRHWTLSARADQTKSTFERVTWNANIST
jgi:ubiquinone/menaquinone biosynthesis C-methylase UbiE